MPTTDPPEARPSQQPPRTIEPASARDLDREAPADELFVWSDSCLVAIVRRRDGRTLSVLRLGGRD